jgi:hypothetical protein
MFMVAVVISHLEMDSFKNCMNGIFVSLKKWFKDNKLTLNVDKTDVTKFGTNSKNCISLNIIILFNDTPAHVGPRPPLMRFCNLTLIDDW